MRHNGRDSRAQIGIVAHGVHDDGGQERAVAELIRRIHPEFDLVVYSSELALELRRLVTWRRIPTPARPAALRFVVFYLLAALRLLRARPRLLHANGPLVPQRLDVASVHCCHARLRDVVGGLAPPEAPRLRRLNTAIAQRVAILAERWSYRPGRTRLFAAASTGVARELGSHYPGIPAVIAPNGVDRERFRPDDRIREEVRREFGVEPASVVSLFVGGDWDHKGLPIAIEGIAQAAAAGRYSGELWVVGRGDENRMKALGRSVGMNQRIRFFGFRRDTERFYQAADVFVLPTAYEAFSLAAHEAACAGLPLVVTPVNGVVELIGDCEAGILAERSADAFADALGLLASDAELRRRLGAAARDRTSRLTWDRSASLLVHEYRKLLDAAPGTGR